MASLPLDSRRAGARNERLILKLLREKSPLSQKQLCEDTGLGSSTASTIVSRLREKGLVCETQGTSTARGPKPVMLRINPEGRYTLGVELNPTVLRIGLFDYMVKSVDSTEIPLRKCTVEHIVETLTVNSLGLLAKNDIDPDIVQGLGVTVSGSVSPTGTVELSSTLGWKHVPLRDLLSKDLNFPVWVFTTRVRLLAEMSLDHESSVRNVLYLNVADGVGANAVIDGHLVHGAGNKAGEIGHMIVDPNGPACGCGHTGCLEALTSGRALAQRIRNDLAMGQASALADRIAEEDTHRAIIQKWGLAIVARDSYALELQDFVTRQLSQALSIAINLYDPQLVILAGYVCEQCCETLIQAIHNTVKNQVYDGATRTLAIRPARAGRSRYTKGAAIAVLNDED
ncbi:ROK family transcriptional regulator [Planctomycetota bacterium]